MARVAGQFTLSRQEERLLRAGVRAQKTPQHIGMRMKIILRASRGLENLKIASELGVDMQRVARWRKRWIRARDRLKKAEERGASDKDLSGVISEILSDAPRPGGPTTFSAEQIARIIAIACEDPRTSGYPVSHWTPKEVAAEAIKRKIVDGISIRHVDRFLKGGRSTASQVTVLDDVEGQIGGPRRVSTAGQRYL